MSVQLIYQTYLKHLSARDRWELIRLLAEEAIAGKVEADVSGDTPEEKLRMANLLRAEATQQQWAELSKRLPDVPEITTEEIVAETKAVRRQQAQTAKP